MRQGGKRNQAAQKSASVPKPAQASQSGTPSRRIQTVAERSRITGSVTAFSFEPRASAANRTHPANAVAAFRTLRRTAGSRQAPNPAAKQSRLTRKNSVQKRS